MPDKPTRFEAAIHTVMLIDGDKARPYAEICEASSAESYENRRARTRHVACALNDAQVFPWPEGWKGPEVHAAADSEILGWDPREMHWIPLAWDGEWAWRVRP